VSGRLFSLQLGVDAPFSQVRVSQLVIAGWTGRDPLAVEKHIRELEALGVRRPSTYPIFYRVSVARLALENSIEAIGTQSSGEVELALLQTGGRLWLGVGSDHTDREVEAYGVTVSKQMCDKPFAAQFWPFDTVRAHWDALLLRSYIQEQDTLTAYQEGSVREFREPLDLIARFTGSTALPEETMMFCGTLAAKGGVRPAEHFVFELEDPVLQRKIQHHYRTVTLPIAG
jgi:Protein of unknown function (DUF2848)